MEDNRPNQDLTNQDIEFIKEKVKERPLNRRKLFKKTLLTASMAAIFGLIACVTFLVLEPVFSNLLYPEEEPQQVELKEENIEDEMRPEDMILEEETETETTTELQTVVEKVALEIGDYQKLYRNMYTVAKTFADHSMVTVTGVVSDVDWFDNTYENQGQTAGLIVADNGKELLILVDAAAIRQAEELEVSFYSGRSVSASLKGKDEETGLAILSVALEDIPEDIRKNVGSATMGSSGSSVQAVPVIAIGRPQGAETIIFGMVTSADYYQNLTDHNVRLLKTDMTGLQGTGGVFNQSFRKGTRHRARRGSRELRCAQRIWHFRSADDGWQAVEWSENRPYGHYRDGCTGRNPSGKTCAGRCICDGNHNGFSRDESGNPERRRNRWHGRRRDHFVCGLPCGASFL